MGKLVGKFFGFIIQLYLIISVFIFVPYYNWQYANVHGFSDWLFFGEIVATSKAMAWPYYTFFKKNKQAYEALPPDVLTPNTLDKYVLQINKQAPLNGPYNIDITKVARDGSNLIYHAVARDSDAESVISSLVPFKNKLCDQEEEKFFLSRGVGLSWNYFNNQNKYITSINITPQDCKVAYTLEDLKRNDYLSLEKNVIPKDYRLKNGDYDFPEHKNISYDSTRGLCDIYTLEQLRYDFPKTPISEIIEVTQKNEISHFRIISDMCLEQAMLNGL